MWRDAMWCLTPNYMRVIMSDTMPRTSTFILYDRILDGRLERLLTDLRSQGLSAPEIRDRLRDGEGVNVSPETIRRWIRALDEQVAS